MPISKVGFGFAAGGSEFEVDSKISVGRDQQGDSKPFGGGSGGGVSITPVAFLVVGKNGIRSIPLQGTSHLYDRLMDMAPQVVEKIQGLIKKEQPTNKTDINIM